jgi:hypothetical protein
MIGMAGARDRTQEKGEEEGGKRRTDQGSSITACAISSGRRQPGPVTTPHCTCRPRCPDHPSSSSTALVYGLVFLKIISLHSSPSRHRRQHHVSTGTHRCVPHLRVSPQYSVASTIAGPKPVGTLRAHTAGIARLCIAHGYCPVFPAARRSLWRPHYTHVRRTRAHTKSI